MLYIYIYTILHIRIHLIHIVESIIALFCLSLSRLRVYLGSCLLFHTPFNSQSLSLLLPSLRRFLPRTSPLGLHSHVFLVTKLTNTPFIPLLSIPFFPSLAVCVSVSCFALSSHWMQFLRVPGFLAGLVLLLTVQLLALSLTDQSLASVRFPNPLPCKLPHWLKPQCIPHPYLHLEVYLRLHRQLHRQPHLDLHHHLWEMALFQVRLLVDFKVHRKQNNLCLQEGNSFTCGRLHFVMFVFLRLLRRRAVRNAMSVRI